MVVTAYLQTVNFLKKFGDSAVYYRPGDEMSLARLITEAFNLDRTQRVYKSLKAQNRADQFSWNISAEKTVDVFRKTLQK